MPYEYVLKNIKEGNFTLVINTPTRGKIASRQRLFLMRRTCMEFGVSCITSMDTVQSLISVVNLLRTIWKSYPYPNI